MYDNLPADIRERLIQEDAEDARKAQQYQDFLTSLRQRGMTLGDLDRLIEEGIDDLDQRITRLERDVAHMSHHI